MTLLRVDKAAISADPLIRCSSTGAHKVLDEGTLKRMIAVERKRTERSGQPFLLMLLECGNQSLGKNDKALENILSVLPLSIRDTDIIGWYKDRITVGVVFTGLARKDKSSILSVILSKVSAALRAQLQPDQFNQVSIAFHFFPDAWDHDNPGRPSNPALYPDLLSPDERTSSQMRIKQAMDIVGSVLALILCAPLLVIIALAIKVSSKGPVLFRQQRVGQ